MKAITTTGKIERSGQLSLDHPLEGTAPRSVRVIILFEETDLPVKETLMSAEELQQELKQAFTEAGYDSKDKIINLVQDVKREISQQREQKHNHGS
jgi:hypothetical protein